MNGPCPLAKPEGTASLPGAPSHRVLHPPSPGPPRSARQGAPKDNSLCAGMALDVARPSAGTHAGQTEAQEPWDTGLCGP